MPGTEFNFRIFYAKTFDGSKWQESSIPIDPNGIGVSPEEIKRWEVVPKRLEYYGENRLDLTTFPRPEGVVSFFTGESEYDLEKGIQNTVNNPLRLLRPATLLSVSSLYYENGQAYNYPKYYAQSRSERNYDDDAKERKYIDLVKNFEELTVNVLKSLNEIDAEKRKAFVKKEIGKLFGEKGDRDFVRNTDVRDTSKAENPQSWLVYTVLSILESPSEEITPIGRIRALELLEIYSTRELVEGFRNEKYKSKYHNGYDRMHSKRIPYTFATRDERLQKDHGKLWAKNKKLNAIVVKDSRNNTDWRSTSNNLVQKAPNEAIQIALLLLHSCDDTEGVLSFLKSVPKLGLDVQTKMFGKKATFLIEQKLSHNVDEAVYEGVGLEDLPGEDLEAQIQGLTYDEILPLLRRQIGIAAGLEESLIASQALAANYAWKNMEQQGQIETMRQELFYWRSGHAIRKEQATVNLVEKMDPKGYYRTLGIHPQAFDGLTDEQAEELLKRHYRFFAQQFHPDVYHGADKEKIRLIIEAYEFLKDPNKRKHYSKK